MALKIAGDGDFRVKVFKEIHVTDEFLSLDENTKGCQSVGKYRNCLSGYYQEIKETCGCLPLYLSLENEVQKMPLEYFNYFDFVNFKDSTCITSEELECTDKISKPNLTSNCVRNHLTMRSFYLSYKGTLLCQCL